MDADPIDVVTALIDGVTGRRWDELPDLYAQDAYVVHPMQPPVPEPIVGREGIRRHFARAAQLPLRMQARNVLVHRTADPEVVIAEFDYVGRVTTTGRSFDVRNIFVVRVRDGQIVESRDYANHAALAAAMSGAGG